MKKLPLTKAKLGVIHLFIKTETFVNDADIPSYAVETGIDISDHVKDKANVITLKGTLFSDRKLTYAEKIVRLRRYKNQGRLLTYTGKRTGTNLMITNFTYDSDASVRNGHDFTLVLKEVRIAKKAVKTKKKSAKSKTNSGNQQTQGKKSTVKYHIIKRGDTYSSLGKKYGTDWRQIKKWAGYPDTKIPIGAKVRVK